MRIDLTQLTSSQISNDPNAKRIGKQDPTVADPADGGDRTTLTSDSSSVKSLVSTAMNSPAIRQGLVDGLKNSVNSGNYSIDSSAIASSMIDEHA